MGSCFQGFDRLSSYHFWNSRILNPTYLSKGVCLPGQEDGVAMEEVPEGVGTWRRLSKKKHPDLRAEVFALTVASHSLEESI